MVKGMPVALQLYSVRDALESDFEGTLRQVKDMGYEGVEFAGLYGRTPEAVRKLLEEIGMEAVSAMFRWTRCWRISPARCPPIVLSAAGTSPCRGWMRSAVRAIRDTPDASMGSAPLAKKPRGKG